MGSNNYIILLVTILTCDVILSVPVSLFGNSVDQPTDGTTEKNSFDIIPIPVQVPLLPPIRPYPFPRYRYVPFFPTPRIYHNLHDLQPLPNNVAEQASKHVYLEYDENNKLVYNSTNGFRKSPSESSRGAVYMVPQLSKSIISTNKTYVTPVKSIHKKDFKVINQNSVIIAETFIRPNEKPKTVVKVYYDPSQGKENVTIDVKPNEVIKIDSNIGNVQTITTDKNLDTTTEASLENREDSNENSNEQGIQDVSSENGDENGDDDSTEFPSVSFPVKVPLAPIRNFEPETTTPETNENDDYYVAEDEDPYDYNSIVSNPSKRNPTNDKILDVPTESVPIWIRQANTTPKMFAFENVGEPKTTTAKPRLWFGWQKPANNDKLNNIVPTTTEQIRFAFFRK